MKQGVVLVRPGEVRVGGAGEVLATLGLGSCVAVVLHDPVGCVGALCHALLPHPIPGRPAEPAGRFTSLVVPALVDAVIGAGGDGSRLRAWLVGGAAMFAVFGGELESIGARNVGAARAALEALGIPIESEHTGGAFGRSVFFTVDDGSVEVRSVHGGTIVL